MKKIILLYTIICNVLLINAQTSSATLQGKIIDANAGEDIIGAYVKILKNNIQIALGSTDFEGKYSIIVAPGTYDIQASYVGLATQLIKGVVLNGGRITTLDIQMETSNLVLDAVFVSEYKVPYITHDILLSDYVLNDRKIVSMPTRIITPMKSILENQQSYSHTKETRKRRNIFRKLFKRKST